MQIDVNVPRYRRMDNKRDKKTNLKIHPLLIVLTIVAGVTLSRVKFSFLTGLTVAPFGLAFLLAVLNRKTQRASLITFLSVIIGYLSVYDNTTDYFIYPVSVTIIFLLGYILKKVDRTIKLASIFIIEILAFIVGGWLLGKQFTVINLSFALIKSVVIIPCYFIVKYAISCVDEFGKNYIFSMEELISIGILLCLIISGIGDVIIFHINIRNILALASVITIAYAAGPAVGAVMGVAMGLIIGIVNNDMFMATTLYSICGLVVGMFRETGKIFAALSSLVCCFIIKVYANLLDVYSAIEIASATLIMIIIPAKITREILAEINNEEKSKTINSVEISGMKNEFIERVDNLRVILTNISNAMLNLSRNEKLAIKNKSTALVEKLADRVCVDCELYNKCWIKEFNSTCCDFELVLNSIENGEKIAPRTLRRKCVKINTLFKRATELHNTYITNEAVNDRIAESRKLIASQIYNMATVVDNIIDEFDKDIVNCYEIDKILKKTLLKNKIIFNDVYSYTDKNGRIKIKIKIDGEYGEKYCRRNIIPIISKLVKAPVNIIEDKIVVDPESRECSIVIEENPKFNITSYAAFEAKDGEKYSGDSFNYGKDRDGMYITVLSDGMGSGPEAGNESSMAVDLVEKFMESGFDELTALDTINKIMEMKFNETEKYTTMDMNIIDLYTGEISFIKAGGTISFIKNQQDIQGVSEDSLPFGVEDKLMSKVLKRQLKHGDMVITISDGILDVDRNNIGDYSWLSTYLEKASSDPAVLSRDILTKAKEISGGKILDDMTVIVSKVYSTI